MSATLQPSDVLTRRWSKFPVGADLFEIFDDFTAQTLVDYEGQSIALGTVSVAVDAVNGVVRIANDGTTEDSGYQLQGSMESVALQTGKTSWFQSRLALSDATQSSLFIGACITDTTIQHATIDTLAGGLTITDGVGFFKPDGEATIYGVVYRDSVQLAVGPVGTLVDATYHVLAWEADMTSTAGKGTVRFYVDGVLGGQISSTTLPYSSEEILALSVAWKSGAAAAKNCDVDYLGVLSQR